MMRCVSLCLITLSLINMALGPQASAGAPDRLTYDKSIGSSLVLLNRLPNVKSLLAIYRSSMEEGSVHQLESLLRESKVDLDSPLPAVSYRAGVFHVEGIKSEIKLLSAEKLEFRIDGVRWRYNLERDLAANYQSLLQRLKSRPMAFHFSLFPEALAETESPRSTAKEVTYALGATAILGLAVAAVAIGVVLVAPPTVVLAAAIAPFTALAANIGGWGAIVGGIWWGGSKLADDIRFGKAEVYCKDGALTAKVNGKDMPITRDAIFSSGVKLTDEEKAAVDHFYGKYDCRDTLVGSKLKAIWKDIKSRVSSADADGSDPRPAEPIEGSLPAR